MAAKVDLYNSSYGNYALGAYSEIRFETYGEDYGQTSWVTTAESHEIPKLLQISSSSSVLEIGCGSVATPYISRSVSAARWSDSI